ncbi:hypothetical protein H5410_045625 [Solanum commersonii]|uniref:Spen paralogue and orthologue SPOC C-terminal domain-containing protein n=1 Tax=Solanum commersonii TaxID=4109 RepID=A0A9J5XC62_SOLCO|nr:hypothetical protein H5410_045625 [Solanum commersonii]
MLGPQDGKHPHTFEANIFGCFPHYGSDIPTRPLSLQKRFNNVISRSVITGCRKLLRETVRLSIEWKMRVLILKKRTSDRDPMLDEQYGLGPFGRNVPSGFLTVSQEYNGDARISPRQHYSGHDYIWYDIITMNGTYVCRVVYVPIEKSIESEIPDVINCSTETGFDNLTKHYSKIVARLTILFFLPNNDKVFFSLIDFLTYLSSRDRVGGVKRGECTNMFLVTPSDFIRKVLKIDGTTCPYGVVLKFAPSGTSLPPESYLPRYVDAQEITSSQVSQARSLLTNDLITNLCNFQPSSSVLETVGESASMHTWDVIFVPQSRRYVDR